MGQENFLKWNIKKTYTYKGKKNKTIHPDFIEVCKLSQPKLKARLVDVLNKYYSNVNVGDGFIYAEGTDLVLVTAHMDTVHDACVQVFYEDRQNGRTTIASPQGIGGDDRCGIYMILQLLKGGYRPSVLFCEDEEIGGVGSKKFVKTEYASKLKKNKFLIELDRANSHDLVYYDCGNKEFQDFCAKTTGYKEAIGSFSDISHLSPSCDVASVNISCGYYGAHTLGEYVIFEEMMESVEKTKLLIDKARDPETPFFDYQEVKWVYNDRLYDWDYYGTKTYAPTKSSNYVTVEYTYYTKNMDDCEVDYFSGLSEYECLGQFAEAHPDVCFNDILDWVVY